MRKMVAYLGIIIAIFAVTFQSASNSLSVANMKTFELKWSKAISSRTVQSVDWSNDGNQIATGADQIRILNGSTGEINTNISSNDYVRDVRWSPNNELLASLTNKSVIVWDYSTGTPIRNLSIVTVYPPGISWSPDGRFLAAVDEYSILILNVSSGVIWRNITSNNPIQAIKWSPFGGLIATGEVTNNSKELLRVWDVSMGSVVKNLMGHDAYVKAIDWSPDGKRIAAGDASGIVRIFDVDTEKPLMTADIYGISVAAIKWSPKGDILAVGNYAPPLNVINATNGTLITSIDYPIQRSSVMDIDWTIDGKKIVVGFGDGYIGVWGENYNQREISTEFIFITALSFVILLASVVISLHFKRREDNENMKGHIENDEEPKNS
jgi:WD40 repeat protein